MSQTSLSATDPKTLPRRSSLMMGTALTVFMGAALILGGRPTTKASSSITSQIDAKAPIVQVVEQPSGGKLVICGGGKLPPSIRKQFCNLAGGEKAKIVVIPTATTNADHLDYLNHVLDDWRQSGAASVTLLHTRSREKANDPEFVKPLTEATGIWMTGGDQVCLTDAYLGTLVQKEFKSLLDRGGVIGGTSAGAAVMSGVMIAGGNTKADIGQGFDFIAGAVIDQHFLKRNRVERLVGVLSAHPNLVGLGIDEETALVVDVREHHLSVIGDSYVVACVPDTENKSVRLKFLKSGDQTPLADLKIPALAATPVLGLGSL
ncbi:cyanophycinase [Singulisphaera sp. PoT]|uniref:cyanophycinase n=1 Tax=Singulisphaera sp. PoT TaxID=3411797 RepID=UPI003BF5FE47